MSGVESQGGMTFEEFSQSYSLHDAELHGFHMDYVQRRLTFQLEIWIGQNLAEHRVVYRRAVLILDDVRFLYVEPPHETKELHIGTSIRIDAGKGFPQGMSTELQHLQNIGPISSMFLSELNSSIYFAAGQATLEWTGPEENLASE